MFDKRHSSGPISRLGSVLLSFSITSLVKERLGGSRFVCHACRFLRCRFIVLFEPFVQLLLCEVEHLAAWLEVWNLLAGSQFVEHAFGYTDIHAGLLEGEYPLRGIDVLFQQRDTFQQAFHRIQFLQDSLNVGETFTQLFHKCQSVVLHTNDFLN